MKIILDTTVMSTKEFGATLNLNPATVLQWIRLDKIKHLKLGGRYYIPVSVLDKIKSDIASSTK